jgi:Rps23 Pro-64 3,4-dihydroxylase Tpa1-like proline 4-hydroxylase
MNYSIATRGYNLPTHTDKKTRILVFLLYLNDLNENSGGALEIYSKIDKKTNSTDKKFFLENKFQPKKGKLIVFLSNPVSYHNVGNILDESKRYFCYGSYTSNNNLTWI